MKEFLLKGTDVFVLEGILFHPLKTEKSSKKSSIVSK